MSGDVFGCTLVFGISGVAFTLILFGPIVFILSSIPILLVKSVPRLQACGGACTQMMIPPTSPTLHVSPILLFLVLYGIGVVAVPWVDLVWGAARILSGRLVWTMLSMVVLWTLVLLLLMVSFIFLLRKLCLKELISYLSDIGI